jgi:hypothetical protein
MSGDKKDTPLPTREHDSLPPMVFDPGEVTATYPIGALTQHINDFEGESVDPSSLTPAPPPDAIASQLEDLRKKQSKQEAAPAPTHSNPPPKPRIRKRKPSKAQQGPSRAVLFAISLTAGGGLAILVVLLAVLITKFL